MKSISRCVKAEQHDVAPLVGAWIEIQGIITQKIIGDVAPLVGAWIEIHGPWQKDMVNKVAPLVGAWIEIVVGN